MKTFHDLDQQVKKLQSRGLIVDNGSKTKKLLLDNNYFVLNGYRRIFLESPTSERYVKNTKFVNIISLKYIDEYIAKQVLSSIFQIELRMKSMIAYYFTEQFGESQNEYYDVNNYDTSIPQGERRKLTYQLNKRVLNGCEMINGRPRSDAIHHYVSRGRNLPLWVLVKNLTFGNMVFLYEALEQSVKIKIAREFKMNKDELLKYLKVLNLVRNKCAHVEKIFDYKHYHSIRITPQHTNLLIEGVQYGQNDLSSIFMIILKLNKGLKMNFRLLRIKWVSRILIPWKYKTKFNEYTGYFLKL